MTDKSFIDRLLALIEEIAGTKYGSKKRFAEMLCVDPSYIDRWTNQNLYPSAEHLANIQDKLHISIDWLLTGRGDRFIKPAAGEVREPAPPYGLFTDITDEERDYLKRLLKLLRTKQDKTVIAIKQNIDAFLDTPNKQRFKKTAGDG